MKYAPLNTLKPIADDIWIVDGPHIKFYGVHFPTRMVIVRLENGDIWLHSPTEISSDLLSDILKLGPIRHLVAPCWSHYAFVHQWQNACPEARTYAAPMVQARAKKFKNNMRCDEELTDAAPDAWAGEIKQLAVKGSKHFREVVFFHEKSKTLMLTDLVENTPTRELPVWFRLAGRMLNIVAPNGGMGRDMRLVYKKDPLRDDILTLIDWAPERVVFAHGDWYKEDGTNRLKQTFDWLL